MIPFHIEYIHRKEMIPLHTEYIQGKEMIPLHTEYTAGKNERNQTPFRQSKCIQSKMHTFLKRKKKKKKVF